MDRAIDEYRQLLQQVKTNHLELPNRNLDTGRLTRAGDYALADRSYVALVHRLAEDRFRHVTPELRANILAYFREGAPANGSVKPGDWKKVQAALLELKESKH